MSYEDNRELCVGITQYTMESEQIQELTDYVSEFGLKFPSINLLNGDDKTVVGTEWNQARTIKIMLQKAVKQ